MSNKELAATIGLAPSSCLEILNNGDSYGDGPYWLDPNGDGADPIR